MQRLTQKQVANSKAGRIGDKGGTGLILETSLTLRRRWLIRFSRPNGGGVTESTLGQYPYVTLQEAREKAFDFRRRLSQGLSPVAPKHVTFADLSAEVLLASSQSAKNPRLSLRQRKGLLRYTKPLHDRSVASIETSDVLEVLMPIWTTKPSVALRVRALIEATLDIAKVKGLRGVENVARYRNHLALVLPKRLILTRGHHRALPYDRVSALMSALEQDQGVVSRAFRFTVLCALRKGETIGLRWSDISDNGDGPIAIIPAFRTKQAKEHRIPLSSGSLAVLKEQRLATGSAASDEYVFPSPVKEGRPLNDSAFNDLLVRHRFDGTPHGIARSSFRDWIADCTEFPRDLAEMCLGHVVAGVEGAYRRSDMLERRRAIMQAWSNFIVGP